jgi:hypothetical protein
MINEKLDVLQAKIEAIEAQIEDNPDILTNDDFYILFEELIDLYSVIKEEIYTVPLPKLSEVGKELLAEDMRKFKYLELRIEKIHHKIDREDEVDTTWMV